MGFGHLSQTYCFSEISDFEKSSIVNNVVNAIVDQNSHNWNPTPSQREACYRGVRFHIDHIAVAARYQSQELFDAYLHWLFDYLVPNICSRESLSASFRIIKNEVEQKLSHLQNSGTAAALCERASDFFLTTHQDHHETTTPLTGAALPFLEALLKNDREKASKIVFEELQSGATIHAIYENIFEKSQRKVGYLWQQKMISVAQEHYCTAATQYCMSTLYSHIFNSTRNGLTFVGCCVSDDLHEIGMRMISDFFALDGFNSIFLGASCPADAIVDTLQKHRAEVIGISVSLNHQLIAAEKLIQKIKAEVRPVPLILLGGRPFFNAPHLFKTLGADYTALNAAQAVEVVKQALRDSAPPTH